MARICIIGPNQLGSSPRLVRNADCLAAAGHDVTVIYPDHLPRFRTHDASLIAAARWRAQPLDFHSTPLARLRWQFARLRHRLLAKATATPPTAARLLRSYGYFGPELLAAARRNRADLYLAQQQMVLTAAAEAARATGARYAVDVEDIVSENTEEPVAQVRAVEARYFPDAAFLCTMSEAAAGFLQRTATLVDSPLALHNAPSLAERAGLVPPDQRSPEPVTSIYWFGQTVGPHACAELVIQALPLLRHPARLVLRGHAQPAYAQRLHHLAAAVGHPDALTIEPPAPPLEMVRLAAAHVFCLGTQPGTQLFHQLAVGNKVCTGMMAGCAVGLTDTIAHRTLLAAHPGWAFTFASDNPAALAAQLNHLLDEPARLAAMRRTAWELASTTFNWEAESQGLVQAVTTALNRH